MPQIQTIRKDESMTPKEMALTAAKALDEKKGGDIAAIEITEQTTLADYFVIATGNSQHPGQRPVRRSGEGHEGAGGGGSSPPGGATGTAPGSCWTTAVWWSTCSPPRPGSSIRWSGFGTTASRWISPVC